MTRKLSIGRSMAANWVARGYQIVHIGQCEHEQSSGSWDQCSGLSVDLFVRIHLWQRKHGGCADIPDDLSATLLATDQVMFPNIMAILTVLAIIPVTLVSVRGLSHAAYPGDVPQDHGGSGETHRFGCHVWSLHLKSEYWQTSIKVLSASQDGWYNERLVLIIVLYLNA